MERLTLNDLNKVCYDPWELCGMDSYCIKGCHEEGGCTKGCNILKIYRKLAEYEDLEEQGLLLKLPCKVGKKVYKIYKLCNDATWEIEVHKIRLEDLGLIGKTVFLTQAEAEEALKEGEHYK